MLPPAKTIISAKSKQDAVRNAREHEQAPLTNDPTEAPGEGVQKAAEEENQRTKAVMDALPSKVDNQARMFYWMVEKETRIRLLQNPD